MNEAAQPKKSNDATSEAASDSSAKPRVLRLYPILYPIWNSSSSSQHVMAALPTVYAVSRYRLAQGR